MKTNLADKWFSRYIRLRDANNQGIAKCCTCDTYNFVKKMDCGHYIKRQHQAARYNVHNCSTQCKRCNNFEQGNDTKFRQHLVDMYGENKVLLVESSKRTTVKRSANDMKLLADHYKELTMEMLKIKGVVKWW